jgi:hypothetical protein
MEDAATASSALAAEQLYRRNTTRRQYEKGSGLTSSKNGCTIHLVRLQDRSAACTHNCISGADLLQALTIKEFWKATVPKQKLLIKTVAVAETAEHAVSGLAMRFGEATQPGDVWAYLQQRLSLCEACAQERLQISRLLLSGADKNSWWDANLARIALADSAVRTYLHDLTEFNRDYIMLPAKTRSAMPLSIDHACSTK